MKTSLIALLALVVVGGGYYWYSNKSPTNTESEYEQYAEMQDLGMYPYRCDNDREFILSPLEGMTVVQVSGNADGVVNGTANLTLVSGTEYAGKTPSGQDMSLRGDGETVYLTIAGDNVTCQPKPSNEGAPWNWGDASIDSSSVGKLDINVVCESALAYMSFENGEAAAQFVAECKAGEHPEVIERYRADMNLGDGAVI